MFLIKVSEKPCLTLTVKTTIRTLSIILPAISILHLIWLLLSESAQAFLHLIQGVYLMGVVYIVLFYTGHSFTVNTFGYNLVLLPVYYKLQQ